jgi:hypothetical protein
MHSTNVTCETHDAEAVTIAKDIASTLMSLGQRHSEALCMTHVS